MKMIQYLTTPVGVIGIAEEDGAITDLRFLQNIEREGYIEVGTPLTERAAAEIEEYFKGERKSFDLPIRLDGTEFQKKVWGALLEIPYGQTQSYGEIAGKTGNKKAVRAVGMANKRNPVSIIVPCHRVIGSDGSLVGYGGGLPVKELLIAHEKRVAHEKTSP